MLYSTMKLRVKHKIQTDISLVLQNPEWAELVLKFNT